MNNSILPASLMADFYKLSHRYAYPKGTTKIYSTFTPRSNKYLPFAKEVVVFGIQAFIKKYLIEYFDENFFKRSEDDVANEYTRMVKYTLGIENPDDTHIRALHKLGYLPLEIKALPEGTLAPIQVPVLTVENTHPDFFWLTNYIETLMSAEIWLPITSATQAYYMRQLVDEYAIQTTGQAGATTDYQLHDFSFRGMSSLESAMASGAGHLLSSNGTDTIPAIWYLEKYYNANIEQEVFASSVSATEHSCMSALTPADGDRDEYEAYKYLITEVFPSGIVSIVSDTYDLFKVVGEVLPALKDEIVNRDGKVVIRPDSSDPADILCGKVNYDIDLTEYFDGSFENLTDDIDDIASEWAREACEGSHNCGNEFYTVRFKINDKIYSVDVKFEYNRHDKTYYYVEYSRVYWNTLKSEDIGLEDKGLIEALWETFGGTINEKGYKVLDSHIGAIYGDSMTYDRIKEICERLKKKGFASTNVVFGVGSYTYQYKTRDSLGFAMKATYAEINGEPVMLMKDPKTDTGKKSQRGMVAVLKDENNKLFAVDGLDENRYDADFALFDQLKTVFVDGGLMRDQSLSDIRLRLHGGY